MILTSSGLHGEPLGGLLGRLGGLLGALEASWAVLEASWGHLGRLGGHLGRLGGVLEAILSHLGRLGTILGHLGAEQALTDAVFGWPAGRAETHWRVLLGKEPKPKPKKSSTPGTPVINQQGAADIVTFGPSRHRAWVVG